MQDIGAIRQKLKQVVFRHLKRKLDSELRVRPENCYHNQKMHTPKQGMVGVCRYGWSEEDWPGVCDSKVRDCSQGCPHFQPTRTKEEIKDNLHKFLVEGQVFEIAAEGMADVASLLWVLGEDAPGRVVELADYLKNVKVFGVSIPVDVAQEAALQRVMALLEDKDQAMREALEEVQDNLQESQDKLKEAQAARCEQAREHAHVSQLLLDSQRERDLLQEALRDARSQTWWQRLWGGPPALSNFGGSDE